MKPTLEAADRKGWHRPKLKDHATDLGSWLINYPGAHPFWEYWMLTCVTLADVPGVPPAKKHFPEATHELLILAIDPKWSVQLEDFMGGGTMPFLSPTDVVYQAQLPSDDLAVHLMELTAKDIVNRGSSPDQDYRTRWKEVLDKTSAHLRGEHGAQA